jgi:hypothetical protein
LEAAGEEGDQGKGDVYCIQPGGTRGCEVVMGRVQQKENRKIQVEFKKRDRATHCHGHLKSVQQSSAGVFACALPKKSALL